MRGAKTVGGRKMCGGRRGNFFLISIFINFFFSRAIIYLSSAVNRLGALNRFEAKRWEWGGIKKMEARRMSYKSITIKFLIDE